MPRLNRFLHACCAALLWAALSMPSGVAQKTDHDHSLEQGKHVHGVVTFNVVVEAGLLSIEIDAPAINVLGFEKSPRSDAERKAVSDVNAWFGSGREIAAVPRAANCRLDGVVYQPPKLGSGHADYRPRFTFRCSNPAALEWVELWALRRFADVEKTTVNLITPTTQRQESLAPGALRVSLK